MYRDLEWNSCRPSMVYVLVGHSSTPEQDLWRIRELLALGCSPFVMPFGALARWCNAVGPADSCGTLAAQYLALIALYEATKLRQQVGEGWDDYDRRMESAITEARDRVTELMGV